MGLFLSFLGKGGSGRTTVAIAAAKQLASRGSRVLLVGHDPGPAFRVLLGAAVSADATTIAPNFSVVQLQATHLLEQNWEKLKELEQQYLRSPTLKQVYGQELGVLPGLDQFLALNALREYDASNAYDVILYDGSGDLAVLRMLGTPEIFGWYVRRFRQVWQASDIGKAISPFIQPVTSAILNIAWNPDEVGAKNETDDLLAEGKAIFSDPNRVRAYLVTPTDAAAIATAQYLWGSAQQIGVTVEGVLLNQGEVSAAITTEFAPLSVSALPTRTGDNWQALMDALPDLTQTSTAPAPLAIDTAKREVRVFLPGFDKTQVNLTQYGPEITIEAGDQRRNINLQGPLRNAPIKGAKFRDRYLIISL